MGEKFRLKTRHSSNFQGSLTCRKSATWDRRLYFPSEGRRDEDFFARKIRRLRPGQLNRNTKMVIRKYSVHSIIRCISGEGCAWTINKHRPSKTRTGLLYCLENSRLFWELHEIKKCTLLATFKSLLVTWCTNRFNIQQLYALPTLYLCVSYLSEKKQRFLPRTA